MLFRSSVVYALEGETSRLQQVINMRCEEITQLTRTNEEMLQEMPFLKHELQAARNHHLLEAQTFRNQFGRSQDELAEAVEHLKVSRVSLEFHEQQSYTWQE